MAIQETGLYLIRVTLITGLLGAAVYGHAWGQRPTGGASVSGSVLDAHSGRPLPGVVVTLARPGDSSTTEGIDNDYAITMQTDQYGAYRFDQLAIDQYRLRARRLGYRPATIAIDLRGSTPLRVSLELTVNPVLLEPEYVTGPPSQTFPRNAANGLMPSRRTLETIRRDRFIAGDVRVLTEDDMLEGVTLAEADVLRATHPFPSVATRDDYTAELWTRGAPWSHTRVYYDGLPLFNPLHAAGAVGGIHPDAVGAAAFHPGVRDARQGEGAAGTLNVTSRRALTSDVSGSAELSVASARASAASRMNGGTLGWMVAARRSYVDLVSDVVDHIRSDATVHIPYAFFDLVGHVDAQLGASHRVDVSALWERDDVRGDIPNVLNSNRGHWGNRLMQGTLTSQIDQTTIRYTAGISQYDGRIEYEDISSTAANDAPRHVPTDNRITYWTTGTDIHPGWRDLDVAIGYRIVHQEQDYTGPGPSAHATDVQADTLRFGAEHTHVALWASGRRWLTDWLEVDAGVRVEAGESVRNVSGVAIGPRLQARIAWPGDRTTWSGGWGRSFQYTQTVAPTGPGIGPELHLTDVWLLAADTIPAVRSDIASAGVDYAFGDGSWVGAIHVYHRRATGMAVPDPRPGNLLFSNRPVFVDATNVARGLEVSIRRVAGRWNGSLAYALGESEVEATALRYPADSDRRHVVDATVLYQPSGPLRLGLAATVSSGAPYTRVVTVAPRCDSIPGLCSAGPLTVEAPNGARGAAFTGVNAMGEWRHDFRGWRLAIALQLRNVLNRANAVTYAGSIDQCTEPSSTTVRPVRPGVCDEFVRGLPLLPLISIRAEF
jgi:hypothetical protein